MVYRLAAGSVILLHLAFIMFALFGGAMAVWRRWIPLIHLPTAAWAVYIEITGGVCPLTDLENALRLKAGRAGYAESFVERYLMYLIYPENLTRDIQIVLAGVVVAINLAVYFWLFTRRRGLE